MDTRKDIQSHSDRKDFDTLPKYLKYNFNQGADDIALRHKKFGVWQKYIWRQYYETVKALSLGLISLGLEHKDTVCLCGSEAPEWFWSEFAVQAAGGVAAAIPVDASPAVLKSIFAGCNTKYAIVSGREQVENLLAIKQSLPALQKIIYWDPKGLSGNADPLLIRFNKVLDLGSEYEKTNSTLFAQNIERGRGEDTALISYSLAANGTPTGIMLTHRALLGSAHALINRFPVKITDNLMAQAFRGYFAAVPHLVTGATLNLPETPETTFIDTREIAPECVFSLSEQWEITAAAIRKTIKEANQLQRGWYNFFLQFGYRSAEDQLNHKQSNVLRRNSFLLADRLVLRGLRGKFGLCKVRIAAADGNNLNPDSLKLLLAVGLELRQMYSLTETGLISTQGDGEVDFTTAGRPAAGTEIRITGSGNLLVRSRGLFSGYADAMQQTAGVSTDGWFRTEKNANIDEQGRLILLNNGNNA
jgi:long-chain acyl-CoA synthetase